MLSAITAIKPIKMGGHKRPRNLLTLPTSECYINITHGNTGSWEGNIEPQIKYFDIKIC